MKITTLTSEVYEWERPGMWNGSHYYGDASLHVISVHTDEGISGYGWNGGTAATRPQRIFPWFADHYRPMLLGKDPRNTEELVRDLWEKQIKIFGPAGVHTQVLAAILIACWDIKGKAANTSIHQLLGGAKSRVPAYIAGGYYAEGKGLAALQAEMLYNVETLHARSVKMKIGDSRTGMKGDLERVAAVREALGPDIQLLVDANCAFDLETAMELSQELANYGVYWFEEPMPIYPFSAHQQLKAVSPVKIATGENYYTLSDFEGLIEHEGVDIVNVDAAICPGYDVAQKAGLLAHEKGLTIAPHGCQELQLPLVAGLPNGELLEYYPPEVDPLRREIFMPIMELDADGCVTVSDRPGLGFELNLELLKRYRVA